MIARIRNISIFLALLLATSVSCQKGPHLKINGDNQFTFSGQGGTSKLSFSCNRDWFISSSESWCSASPSSGTAKEDGTTITIKCEPNTGYDPRTCVLTITVEGITEQVTVEQASAEGLQLPQSVYELTAAEQNIEVTIQANVEYIATIEPSCENWIARISTKGLSSDKLTFKVFENTDYDGRVGHISIVQKGGNLKGEITIRQAQKDGLFVETQQYTVSDDEQTLAVDIKSNIPYDVIPEVEWIEHAETKALAPTTANLKIAANESTFSRTGKVVIKKTGGDLSQVVTITQQARPKLKTENASDISYFGALLNGSLAVESMAEITGEVWFLYSSSATSVDGLKTSGAKVISTLADNGLFAKEISGLSIGTNYYYVACAKVNGRDYYGEVRSFTTSNFSASVSTSEAVVEKLYRATLSGIVSFENIGNLTKSAGFIFGEGLSSLDKLKESGQFVTTEIDLNNTFKFDLTGLKCGAKYYYTAWVKVHDRVFYGNILSFSSKELPVGAVDLGLSIAWASCNIDANAPEEYGGYYAWGEVETKNKYDWDNYKWGHGEFKNLTKYNSNKQYGVVDHKNKLDIEDDVAHIKLGGDWRMPTKEDFQELIDKCTWTWVNYKGVNGYQVTSKINGNSVFLPASGLWINEYMHQKGAYGEYLSSDLCTSLNCYMLDFDIDRQLVRYNYSRCYGGSIRAVVE